MADGDDTHLPTCESWRKRCARQNQAPVQGKCTSGSSRRGNCVITRTQHAGAMGGREIPNEVIDTYNLHSKPEMVLCNSNGKEWPVRIFTTRGVGVGGRMYMGKGWSEFQKQNEAGPKDRYMFTFGTESSCTTIHVEVHKTPNSDQLH
ncbi:sun domain-containing protein 2 [Phtheirospermum japonicum]|uniref:Sun domain-containing protein 2 n=1 Tax=Phtheirospermum japonicum TaxID=374723 RepID=A0A830C2V4_9LAMI|nr:sun domain-containing protein 2 [Phtheirospermum japonicum]